jgi:type IV pilus assembly protein PilP
MWEAQGFTAMIATPDGKGFLIKKGTLVGPEGGFVQKITEDSIIVEEVYTDYYGKKKSKNTVLRLHAKEEGGG